MYILPAIVCFHVLIGVTQVAGDYGKTDFRYIEHGVTKWCVYGRIRDIEQYGSESECIEKNLPVETHTINGKEEKFYARLSSVEGGGNRYIKNCTAPPTIKGADVDCRDYNGNVFVRVYDTCRVNCTSPRDVASRPTTMCQTEGQWEDVTCIPQRCLPFKKSIKSEGNVSCDPSVWLPLNSTCSVPCPPNYEPPARVFKCVQGLWDIFQTCAPREPVVKKTVPEAAEDWKTPTIITTVLFLLLIVLGIVLRKCWTKKTKKPDISTKNPKMEEGFLLDSSSSSVITSSRSEGNEQSLLSDVVNVGEGDGDTEGDRLNTDEESSASMRSAKELPPSYESAIQPCQAELQYCHGDVFEPGSCQVELQYCHGDDPRMPLLPYEKLVVAEETVLIIYARCSNDHVICMLKCGPPFSDYQELGNRMKVTIKHRDAGSFLLWTKCSNMEDLTVVNVDIQLTDVTGNVDHTNVKQIARSEDDLGSLADTVQEATIDAASGPSQELKAQIVSLPSNPCLYAHTDAGDETKPLRAARSVTSLSSRISIPHMNDGESESCTLRLGKLRGMRNSRKAWNQLLLRLQPLDKIDFKLTIGGPAMALLGFSVERIDYLTWAKRQDLHDSPAHVILTYMIQEDMTACHLVRYFAHKDHHRRDIIELLQKAHPDCPACRKYR